ncbi:predicted protein [Plenodomus lingam JN3]|uniref:Predicted protein n=1 Tax=Leptosphaeria maculans (strain JN3 / isolate v23.1.3 / race Av1-4-5-6-7-8) TaxID=985895 RepID=E4ZK34_LEPMJ|nr:predicted protein [Plenodomus lingam JN3]CBX91629.1 predicted protein [Plenodomus lingam JN3]
MSFSQLAVHTIIVPSEQVVAASTVLPPLLGIEGAYSLRCIYLRSA